MGFKWSEYIISTPSEIDQNSILFCCTTSFNVIRVKKTSRLYYAYNNNSLEQLDTSILDSLNYLGFIVSQDFDERQYSDFCFLKSSFSNSSLSFTILPTDSCNFRCVYCYESPENNNMSELSEESLLKFFKLGLPQYRSFHLSWFGGEPLVRKDQVIRITKYVNDICKNHGVKFSGSITTNGYELSLDTFSELIKNRVLSFLICIDGNETSHNKQRPHYINNDSYQRIMSNLENIKHNCKSNTFVITLRSNVTNTTEQYLDSYLNDIKAIIGSDPRFQITFQGVREWGGERIFKNEVGLVDSESRVYSEWYIKAAKMGLNSAECLPLDFASSGCAGNTINGFVVNPDCSLHKCTLCYYNKDDRDKGRIGQINSDGRMEIDDSVIMRWVNRDNNNMEKCKTCKLYVICNGGKCPYYTSIQGNTMETSNHCAELFSMAIAKIKCMEIKNMVLGMG